MKLFEKKNTKEAPGAGVSEQSTKKKSVPARFWRWMKRHKKLVCLLIVVVIAAGVGLSFYQRKNRMENMMQSAQTIETTTIQRQTLMDSISLSGTVASADSRNISASVEKAEVTKVHVEVGDIVTVGQVICEFDSEDIEASLTDAKNDKILSDYKSEKEYQKIVDTYEAAVKNYEDVTVAYSLTQENAKVAWQAAIEALNQAQEAYDNAAAEEKEAAAAALQKAQTAESEAASAYEKIVEEREAAEEKAESTLESATESLANADLERQYSKDESTQKIESYEQQLEDCYLTAPMDGMIISLSVAEGEIYNGGTIFVIADYQNFIVNASVDEYDIGSLKKGMEAAVKIESVSDEELPATLTYVAPTPGETAGFGSSGSSSYSIEISLTEPNENLRIGMSAQASVVLQAAEDVLTVPADCVQTNRQGQSVIYVQENGERKEVAVTVGMEGDYYVEISGEGLSEGMQVYYGTAMVTDSAVRGSEEESSMFPMGNMGGGGFSGGSMPSGGDMPSGGSMPSGGGSRPSGGSGSGRGGF